MLFLVMLANVSFCLSNNTKLEHILFSITEALENQKLFTFDKLELGLYVILSVKSDLAIQ